MRRFSLFAAYMPSKLVEAQAEIFNRQLLTAFRR